MFTKTELEEKKKSEIMSIAKDLGLPRYKGKSELTKEELIQNILGTHESESVAVESKEEQNTDVVKEKSENKVVEEVKKLQKKKPVLSEEEKTAKKLGYIEGAKVGTLVAFKTETGKIKSAMITKRSTKNRKFMLETKFGAQYVVSFDDIVWVRTNKRWPRGVYQLLKGIDESEVASDATE